MDHNFLPSRDLPNPESKPTSPVSSVLAGIFFTTSATQETHEDMVTLLLSPQLQWADYGTFASPGMVVFLH